MESKKQQAGKKRSRYQQQPAKKNKILAYGFSKDLSQDVPEEVKRLDRLRNAWIPFGDDNLFPQHLSELSRAAATHRAILNTKTTFTIGEGFHTLNESLDSTTARMDKDKKKILFHPDWADVRRTEDKITSCDIYPVFKKYRKGVKRSVVHFCDYESTFYYYGLPDYVAALDHIKIASQIGKYNLTRFKNGFMPSAIIELGADMSEEEAQIFIDEARDKLTGENNNSKILFIAKNGDESASNVKIINDTSDGSFMELQTITNDNIISSHRWNPALSGIQVAGSLGNNQQILTIYDIVMSTVIREPQQMVLRELKKILKTLGGYDVSDLHIVNKPPVTMLGAINPTDYISVQEGRRIFHLPELNEEELDSLLIEKNKIKDGIDNTAASN